MIVGGAEDLVSDDFEVDQVNWVLPQTSPDTTNGDQTIEASVKIRYAHPGTRATVTPLEGGRARIRLHEPQKAVTPGQAAVFYDGDRVIGGGWICRAAVLQPA